MHALFNKENSLEACFQSGLSSVVKLEISKCLFLQKQESEKTLKQLRERFTNNKFNLDTYDSDPGIEPEPQF
jgi:hypothetical protein